MRVIEKLLTIVIPTKNEAGYIGKTLEYLCWQDLGDTQIIIADAGSTDGTLSLVSDPFFSQLNIKVIDGGLPAVARNNGAAAANTKYVLFMDADCEVREDNTVFSSVKAMESDQLHLLTCNLNTDKLGVKPLYWISNIMSRLSKREKPFATGMYMMVDKAKFHEHGGFPENAMHCEDYLLSKKFDPAHFKVLCKSVYSDDRRFKKMGYLNCIRYFIGNFRNRNNDEYFTKDVGYWG